MRTVTTVLCCILLPFLTIAQSKQPCLRIIESADRDVKRKNYRQAIVKYNAAKVCNPHLKERLNHAITKVFDKIDRERKWAIRQNQRHQKALKNMEKTLFELKSRQQNYDVLYKEVLVYDLAFKVQVALDEGDKTTAYQLAQFGQEYLVGIQPTLQTLLEEVLTTTDLAWHQTFLGHTDGIRQIALSSDYRFMATAAMDKTVRVWDLTTGNEQWTLSGHGNGINTVAISPDNQYIVSGSVDNTAKVWETRSGKLKYTLTGHTGEIKRVIISKNKIITGSADRTIKIWKLTTGQEMITLNDGFPIMDMAVSEDDLYLATSSWNKTAKVWDLSTGELTTTLSGHRSSINAIAIAPDNGFVVTGSDENVVKVWDIDEGNCLLTLTGHTAAITDIVVTQDSRYIVSASKDKTVKVWDMEQMGKLLYDLSDHTNIVNEVVTIDKLVITGAADHTAKVWDIREGELVRTLHGHEAALHTVVAAKNGTLILTAGLDGTIKRWSSERSDLKLSYLSANQLKRYGLPRMLEREPWRFQQFVLQAPAHQLWQFARYYNRIASTTASLDTFQTNFKKAEQCYLAALKKDPNQKSYIKELMGLSALYKERFRQADESLNQLFGRLNSRLSNNQKVTYFRTLINHNFFKQARQLYDDIAPFLTHETALDYWNLLLQKDYIKESQVHFDEHKLNLAPTQQLDYLITLLEHNQLEPAQEQYTQLQHQLNAQQKTDYWLALVLYNHTKAAHARYPEVVNLLEEATWKTAIKHCNQLLLRATTNAERYDMQWFIVDLYEDLWFKHRVYAKEAARAYSNLAWYALMDGKFEIAISAVRLGIQKDSSQTWLYTNLALGHLYNGDFDEAMNIYQQYADVAWRGSGGNGSHQAFRSVFLVDLQAMTSAKVKAKKPELVEQARRWLENKGE